MTTEPALILIVDDNPPTLYAKAKLLARAGFQVAEAGTGEAALRLVSERNPHLVLLDMKLPDFSGLEVCRRIKSNDRTRHIGVLHISATFTSEEDMEYSLESGADIFLAEPVEPEELITVVRTLLRLRATEIGLAESETRMRLATEGAGIATWDIDLRTGIAYWNRQLYLLLGYKPNGGRARWEMWKSRIDPADLLIVEAALEKARKEGGMFSQEHRIHRYDTGEERWLAPYGKMHPDEHGEPTRFLGVVVDITSRKRMETAREELLRLEHEARRQAEEAARLKDEFLATLSHELRTPMSAVLGWLHLMRTGRLSKEQETKALDTIERNAHLQTQLINDLLDVSRIISGKLQLEPQPVLLEEVIEAAGNAVRLQAISKDIDLTTTVERSEPIQADPNRLQQVFANLFSNAIKFTPKGGRVEVNGVRIGDSMRVTVTDTGEGIPPHLLPHLFQRFRQADGSTTRRHGGLGLGLAIVRHIVELHGGWVAAASGGVGQGSTFTVTLPLFLTDQTHFAYESATVEDYTPQGVPRLGGLRLLVVDDDASTLELMSEVLTGEGAIVRIAQCGAEALAAARSFELDLLILDIGMPDEDGYELLGKLRAVMKGDDVPAVAVTGYARAEDRDRALAAGFQAHVAKPFDVDSIVETIRKLTHTPP
jgi:PAS domain S-box-containing protein